MPRSPKHPLLRPALLALAGLTLGPLLCSSISCTAIGYAIGDRLARQQPPRVVPAGQALKIGPGTPMAIALEDSSEVRGFYLGRGRLDDATYASRFEAWRARTPDAPALGATVDLVWRHGPGEAAVFEGFAYRSIVVRRDGRSRSEPVPYAKLDGLRVAEGRTWTRDELAALDASGSLPSREALIVGQGLPFDWQKRLTMDRQGIQGDDAPVFSDTARVPVDGVYSIRVPSAGNARTVCTLAGFAVDATIVAIVAAAASYRGPFDGGSGCDAGSTSMWARYAPAPTLQDFDVLAGEFRPAGAPARPDGALLAPAP